MRFFQEPLPGFRPQILLSSGPDHVASPWGKRIDIHHPLCIALNALSCDEFDPAAAGIARREERHDSHSEIALVKEVHSLFAAEQLLGIFPVPAVATLRNPFSCADSILATNGLPDPYRYLMEELESFASSKMQRIGKCQSDTLRLELEKLPRRVDQSDYGVRLIVAVSLLNEYLRDIGNRQPLLRVVQFEELCIDPETLFPQIAEHLTIDWSDRNQAVLEELESDSDGSPYDTKRRRDQQIDKPLRVINRTQANLALDLLERVGLSAPDAVPLCVDG
ncbi:hypothetical protein [Stieleria sedimenti]|uniref:hypothetical protein n=1 Tax=Stieleria sedimenti TaxID=2976331 RepID=UPI002B2115A9|nr:hypothetical protein [Stieleria sedimenti]